MTEQHATQANRNTSIAFFTISVVITQLLFFVDEGHYNFNWMSKLGNWIPFAVYVLAIYSGQKLFYHILLKNHHGLHKVLVSAFGGVIVGILTVVFGIFSHL